ncbi:MAG: GNAT family N-acetyltransferase [Marinibacterium sp.]|nr:GNAT family N-acetyltransferase [Marinibacterium sp.]
MLRPGKYPVAAGQLPVVITLLEMTEPRQRPAPALPEGVRIERVESPTPDWYRDLFRRVGGETWLWFSRLALDDTALAAILTAQGTEIYALTQDGRAEGLLELAFDTDGGCELAFFGLTPATIGSGLGRALMDFAITRAWQAPITRFHLQTCTADSPQALPFYLRSGFAVYGRQVEVFDDPRLTGILPQSAGPHMPITPAKG